jgi:hypothetical protein
MIWTVAAVAVVVMVAVGGVAANSLLQQPNIEVSNVNIGKASTDPQSSTPVSERRVNDSASFSFAASATGTYVMNFDNTFDDCMDKSIALSYSINGQSTSQTFGVQASYFPSTVSASLNKGDALSGQFTVVGGTNNDVNFSITGSTCTANVPFSFVLVNRGLTGAYATVEIQADGQTSWSNSYYVSGGQQSPESASLALPTCGTPQFTVVVVLQQEG